MTSTLTHQLTEWGTDKKAVAFVEDQLKKHGGKQYEWRTNSRGQIALFVEPVADLGYQGKYRSHNKPEGANDGTASPALPAV